MRKFIGLLIIILLVSLPSPVHAASGSNDYARLVELDYTAVITDEPGGRGKAVITERLTYDIHAASMDDLFWELWRDLPEEYVDGVKVEYKVNSVKQVFADRPDVIYTETHNLYWDDEDYISKKPGYGPGHWHHSVGPYDGEYRFECVLFYVNGLYRETVTFEIEYEMYNASMRYADASEFYVSLFDGESIEYLRSLKGRILVPSNIMPGPGNYNAYTYGTNSHTFPFTESSSANPGYHTFSFELDQSRLKFRPYNRYVEFALISFGADRHIFTQHAEINDYYHDSKLAEIRQAQADYEALPLNNRNIKLAVLVLLTAAAIVALATAYTSDARVRKKNKFYQPETDFEYYRDIPSELDPCFAGVFAFSKHKAADYMRDGYAAVLLSLVRKGCIDLVQISNTKGWKPSNVKIVILRMPGPPRDEETLPAERGERDGFAGDTTVIGEASLVGEAPHVGETPLVREPSFYDLLSPTEELYFNLILRHAAGDELPLSVLEHRISNDYDYSARFIQNTESAIKRIGTSLRYFQRADYKALKRAARNKSVSLGLIGFFVALGGNLASYRTRLDLAFGAFFIVGAGLIASAILYQIYARKYYLFTQLGENEYAKWRGLYRFLDSETLMNERVVLDLAIWEYYLIYATAFGISKKVIKALKVRCPDAGMSPVLRNPYFHTRGFYTGSRAFRSATRTAATFTSRGGGWSGYGGGGRGGGGGGGGH